MWLYIQCVSLIQYHQVTVLYSNIIKLLLRQLNRFRTDFQHYFYIGTYIFSTYQHTGISLNKVNTSLINSCILFIFVNVAMLDWFNCQPLELITEATEKRRLTYLLTYLNINKNLSQSKHKITYKATHTYILARKRPRILINVNRASQPASQQCITTSSYCPRTEHKAINKAIKFMKAALEGNEAAKKKWRQNWEK